MRFSTFIEEQLDEIVREWASFARSVQPSSKTMSELALRDHCRAILLAIAKDMNTGQSEAERSTKSRGTEDSAGINETAAATHGVLRQLAGFDLSQLVSEFRAMRASVLALWRRHPGVDRRTGAIEEIARFNEGIDQALAESVNSYSAGVEGSRDMFLAILGHDLRGPLAGIRMSNQMLSRPGLSEGARLKAAQRIGRAATDMNLLITDLIEFTRTRLGSGIPIQKGSCDVGGVCREAVDAIQASHPGQRFELRRGSRLTIPADAARLQQALCNLLNNAVQHGDPGRPVLLDVEGGDREVVLRVTNAGKPIKPESLQLIFEPLIRLPGAGVQGQAHSKTSLGLGLFIVREIARGHGGEVSVGSSIGEGTVFTLRLPRDPSDRLVTADPAEAASS